MGGSDSTHARSPDNEKSKSKMSLSKFLSQRKSKSGSSKNISREARLTMYAPPEQVASPTRYMFRGYCDQESRTTRFTLCCAMTESSSQTPSHSHPPPPHPFACSPQPESISSDEGAACMVKFTKDASTQTSQSPPGRTENEPRTPEKPPIDVFYHDTKQHRNENFRRLSQLSLNEAISSSPSTSGMSTDERASSTTKSSSSASSSIQTPPQRSFRNVALPKASVRCGADSVMTRPEYRDMHRFTTSQVIIRNSTVVCGAEENEGEQAAASSSANKNSQAAGVLHVMPTDKARERNFLQRRSGANSLLGAAELEKALPMREIQVFVGTWNMNGHLPPSGINDFMLPEELKIMPDIFAIGTQESHSDKYGWEVKIQETIGPSHVLLHSSSLGSIHLAIFIRRDLTWFCSVVEESSLSVRPGVGYKTKGAVAISFILFGTSFLFITAHLTAHEEKVDARVQDIKRILKSLDLPKSLPLRFRSKHKDVTQNFDSVFLCGDLNFRLSEARDNVIQWVEEYEFPLVVDLKNDQLTQLINEEACMSSFQEGVITFPPTYKYDPGTQKFDSSNKHRTPAYTDRILFKSKGENISCLAYSSAQRISTSDHKPVWGLYKGVVRPGIDTIPLTAGLFNRDVYLAGIKRRANGMGRKKFGVSAICCIQ